MLPIALKSFHIKGYRGIIDTELITIPDNTQWIFLTGENGFGKTSVLQGIVMGLINREERGSSFECVSNTTNNQIPKPENNEYNYEYLKQELMNLNSIAAYGSTRLRVSSGTSLEVMKNSSPTSSLFSNDTLLINIEENFKDWKNNDLKSFNALENIFKTLIPQLHKIEVIFDKNEKRSKVKYYEKDVFGNVYNESIDFLDLAAGYKNIIAMIGDMINRLSFLVDLENLDTLNGIVLIDEIDLHLHPKYQKLFVQKLTELFPKIQFIVSTHSPIPLLGVGKDTKAAIINVSRTREEGIKAELLDIDFSVLTPNAILSSPIFGFQDLIPESKSDDKMIRTEDTYKEVLFNDQLDKQISEYLTEDNQKELLDLLKEHNL